MVYSQIAVNKRNSVLLFIGFFILLIFLGYVFGYIFQFGTYFGIIFGFIFSLISALISYYLGDKIVLRVSRAKEIQKQNYPALFNIVEALSLGAGIPMPKLHVIEDNAINAFATGRDPKHASVAVTTGSLTKLNKEELEGVLAHELSHVKNLDIRFMVLVSVMVGTIVMLSDFFLRGFLFRNSDNDNKNVNVIVLIIGFALAILSPLIAELIKLAISRKREYLADSSGALLTKNPKGLANALKKIGNDHNILQTANHATAPLFISNPFKNKKNWLNLFQTHPPIESRIQKLEEL